jgi:GNAT superfamily N-acetyltransferase
MRLSARAHADGQQHAALPAPHVFASERPRKDDPLMTWHIDVGSDDKRADWVDARLVEHNREASEAMRQLFADDHRRTATQAFALDDTGAVIGGCVGWTVNVWHWLYIDTMWVHPSHRGQGIGRELLETVESEARDRGCRWAKLNTWEFQAPEFYSRLGYVVYGREVDYPPGHVNHLMRKDLVTDGG